MADEPKNSQQIIDDTTKALGQPELIIVPQKPMKKKGGKGMLIGMLIFFILTLPVAIYYGFQQYTQITERRSKAVAPPRIRTCYPYTEQGLASCQSACQPQTFPCNRCSGNYGCQRAIWTNYGPCEDSLNPVGGMGAIQRPTDCSCPRISDAVIAEFSGNNDTCSSCATPTTRVNTPTTRPEATNTPAATVTPITTSTTAPTNTPTAYYTPAPGQCDASCESDSNCLSGLVCSFVSGIKRCRNALCPLESNCSCTYAAATPTTGGTYVYNPSGERVYVYYTPVPPRERVIAEAPIITPTSIPTPKVPVSGTVDLKAIIMMVGALFFVALGIIL